MLNAEVGEDHRRIPGLHFSIRHSTFRNPQSLPIIPRRKNPSTVARMRRIAMKRGLSCVGMVVGLALWSAGCASSDHEPMEHTGTAHGGAWKAVTAAVAVVHPTAGNNCMGVVHFTQVEGGVKVVADLQGLAPGSVHAFHVHEFGDCSAPDAASAGSHYDPAHTGHHGMPGEANRHIGDMGNLTADASGNAHLELTLSGASVAGMANPIIGRSVIVHAKADDFSQPVGNAGARIGCGVIGIAKPAAP
jgi:superoxide dismutase, Cu-Zn family